MKISVALPMRSWTRQELKEFATRADEGPFHAINVGERLCYDNYDPIVGLSVLAGLTDRVKLMTGIMILPIHDPVILAKQVASLHALSQERMVFGVGVGPRKPDFDATLNTWNDRGARFEKQVSIMKKVWSGQPPYELSDLPAEKAKTTKAKEQPWNWAPESMSIEPVPPFLSEGSLTLIFGGFIERQLRRAGRLADGFHSFDFAPDVDIHLDRYRVVREAWDENNRNGKPWFIASTFFALGENADEVYAQGMKEFYGYADSTHTWASPKNALTSKNAIKETIKKFEDAGVDELLFASAHHMKPEVISMLGDVVSGIDCS